MTRKETPSQTAGPYVHIGCAPTIAGLEQRRMGADLGAEMVPDERSAITLDILVLDGAGDTVKDALIEIWQAGPDGGYSRSDSFRNWGRGLSDLENGHIHFRTQKPGRVGTQALHVLLWIVARGINVGLTTRIYFPDEDNVSDPILALAGSRASTLVARKTTDGYAHTIHLQGDNETVFFDI